MVFDDALAGGSGTISAVYTSDQAAQSAAAAFDSLPANVGLGPHHKAAGTRDVHATPVIQVHLRPRTSRRLQGMFSLPTPMLPASTDFSTDVTMPFDSRPGTAEFVLHGARHRSKTAGSIPPYGRDAVATRLRSHSIDTDDPVQYSPEAVEDARRRIQDQKQMFLSIQHAAAAEAANLTECLSDLDSGLWDAIPGQVSEMSESKRWGNVLEQDIPKVDRDSSKRSYRSIRKLSLHEESHKALAASRAQEEIQRRAVGRRAPKTLWWRDRGLVEKRALMAMGYAVIFGLCGNCMSELELFALCSNVGM